jgi:hypothetical protein
MMLIIGFRERVEHYSRGFLHSYPQSASYGIPLFPKNGTMSGGQHRLKPFGDFSANHGPQQASCFGVSSPWQDQELPVTGTVGGFWVLAYFSLLCHSGDGLSS